MRKIKNKITLLTIITSCLALYGQEKERPKMTEKQAREFVLESLSDSTYHNVIGSQPILTKREKAIEFAEFILWDVYGKKNIEKQKPYNVFQIDNYWFLSGTLPKEMLGGTFALVIDSRNCRIVKLTHGK